MRLDDKKELVRDALKVEGLWPIYHCKMLPNGMKARISKRTGLNPKIVGMTVTQLRDECGFAPPK